MNLNEETTLANNPAFQARVRAVMIRRAIVVMDNPNSTETEKALAKYSLSQPDAVAIRVAQVAAALGAIDSVPDVALVTLLGGKWETLSKLLIYT